jgi:hypothetical protein
MVLRGLHLYVDVDEIPPGVPVDLNDRVTCRVERVLCGPKVRRSFA